MMKRSKRFAALILTGVMAATTLFGCGSSSGGAASDSSAADSSSNKVLKVGMECAYAPFNWTQDTDTTPDGSKAVKIAGSDYYAYGYDVAVAQKLADQMGMDLEVHKVEWSSIGISLDAGDYDCIIAGMGKTKVFRLLCLHLVRWQIQRVADSRATHCVLFSRRLRFVSLFLH